MDIVRWAALALWVGYQAVGAAALPPEAARVIEQAGNAESDRDRQVLLEKLAALPELDAETKAEASALADLAGRWDGGSLKFYTSAIRGKAHTALGDYDFKVAADSPLRPLTGIYRGRMLAWMLIENSTVRTSPKDGPWFKDEAVKSFRSYVEKFPRNRIAGMYLGKAIPWAMDLPKAEGAPEWAVLQREQLERLRAIILWWIDHRQRDDGQFGGGWGDDCEMWRWWAAVLLGFDDPKITEAQLKFSKAAVSRPHLKGGFNTEVMDVEHAAEDTTDNLIPLMVLEPDNKRWRDWPVRLGDFMRGAWTGRNERGHLQFRSFYLSATTVAPQPQRAFDVIANVGALHPALLIWQQTRDAKLGEPIAAWLDTWVDATARADGGKPAGILPSSIRWPDGAVAGAEGNWWEPVKPGGYMHSYYVWPSVITEMTDALVVAHLVTRKAHYLEPIRSMAQIRLKHLKGGGVDDAKPGTEAWCAAQLAPRQNANSNVGGLVKTLARLKALTGTTEFDELLAMEGGEFVIQTNTEGRRELIGALRESAEALRVNFPGFTSEVRSTDRVMRFVQFLSEDYQFDAYKGVTQPKHELLYRMVTGDKNAPRFPQMAVRWLTPPKDIAVLVTQASTDYLEAELFHFGDSPRAMKADLRLLAPGEYRVGLMADEKPVGEATRVVITPGGRTVIDVTLPARKLCVLRVERRDER
jgi:hypothetical protein